MALLCHFKDIFLRHANYFNILKQIKLLIIIANSFNTCITYLKK